MPPIPDVIVVTIAMAGCTAAAIIDLRTRRVPNALTLTMAVAGVVVAATGMGRVGLAASVGGCVLGLALMLPGYLFGATGAGDVKLLAAAGTLLGPWGTLMAFCITAVAGGVLALFVAANRGRLAETFSATVQLVASAGATAPHIENTHRNNRFAYAPAIAVGVAIAACRW